MKERQNECSSPLLFGSETYFICFSPAKGWVNFAEKFLAIFSPALTFSPALLLYTSMRDAAPRGAVSATRRHLVLSLVSRQEKERSSESSLQPNLKVQVLDGICSFSFARPKENEPKVPPCGIPHHVYNYNVGAGKRAPCGNGSGNCHCRKRPVPQHGRRF